MKLTELMRSLALSANRAVKGDTRSALLKKRTTKVVRTQRVMCPLPLKYLFHLLQQGLGFYRFFQVILYVQVQALAHGKIRLTHPLRKAGQQHHGDILQLRVSF